jgi:hypothetical protein
LLCVLRKLIDYGKELALTLQERTASTNLFDIKMRFGRVDVAAIIACITRGLLLAVALEARLISHPVRPEAEPTPARAKSRRKRRPALSAEQAAAEAEARLFRLPTPAQVAAAVRGRPAGSLLVDICRDLGLDCTHPLWNELRSAIIDNDGNYGTLVTSLFKIDRMEVIETAGDDLPPPPAGWLSWSGPAPARVPAASGAGPPEPKVRSPIAA